MVWERAAVLRTASEVKYWDEQGTRRPLTPMSPMYEREKERVDAVG
jgi:hypothetical protein